MPAGLERGPRDVVVRGVRHGHDDQLDVRVREQRGDRRHHGDVGKIAVNAAGVEVTTARSESRGSAVISGPCRDEPDMP